MTLVVDAGLVVAGLVDGGPVGTWAEEQLAAGDLAAPHLMPVEAANILRRASLAGQISSDTASIAHDGLLGLKVALFAYAPFASRAWELRPNVTIYDACYVALAESLECPLATLDRRLSQAPRCLCAFLTPP